MAAASHKDNLYMLKQLHATAEAHVIDQQPSNLLMVWHMIGGLSTLVFGPFNAFLL